MDLGKMVISSLDINSIVKNELTQGLDPILSKATAIEKKIDTLILTLQRVESLLTALQPLTKLLTKLPFFK
jgi:hypothetical protein